jgi:hypothetical protein
LLGVIHICFFNDWGFAVALFSTDMSSLRAGCKKFEVIKNIFRSNSAIKNPETDIKNIMKEVNIKKIKSVRDEKYR